MKKENKLKTMFLTREYVLLILVIMVGLLFFVRLIDLQIVNGAEYREKSLKKMARTVEVEAPRGEIYDRNGIVLASNRLGYDLSIYRTKIDNLKLNEIILKTLNILEKNGDKFNTSFPIENGKIKLYNDKEKKNLLETFDVKETATLNEIIEIACKKYEILDTYNELEKLNIIKVRYEISINGYSLFKSVKIATDISYESMAMIEEIKSELPGIYVNTVSKRIYPYSNLFSHLIGYTGKIDEEEYANLKGEGYSYISSIGKLGVEKTYEKYLKGVNGIIRTEVDSLGNTTSEYTYSQAISGANVTLTVDYRLQAKAKEALVKVINDIKQGNGRYKKYADASSGAVVALNVKTGEVLSMVSYPDYDTNLFINGITNSKWRELNANSLRPMFNRIIGGTYSPGSTYKMLTAIAGLESKAITTTERIRDTGVYAYGHHPKCWIYTANGGTHGNINVSQAIKVSCNCYFYEVGRRMGIDELVKYTKNFGLGQKTGIEILGEQIGMIAGDDKTKEWYLGDTLSAAIGQSYNSFTPIQMVNYIATLANGGTLNKVTIIKSVTQGDVQISDEELNNYAKEITGVDFKVVNNNLNKNNIKAIVDGMESVTSELGGTSYIAFRNTDFKVAGKTGTAEVSKGSPNAIFVGFAPISDPEIAVVAVIEHGGSGTYTADVVKPILEEYFNLSRKDTTVDEVLTVNSQNIDF